MNLSYASYSPNQAVSEYQASLQAQKSRDEATQNLTPLGMVATYTLADRVPDWTRLLDIEKPHLYSTAGLATAIIVLANTNIIAPGARATAQTERFIAELATRS